MERWVEYYLDLYLQEQIVNDNFEEVIFRFFEIIELDVFLIEEEFFEVIDEFVRGKVLGNNNIFVEIFKVNKEFFFF